MTDHLPECRDWALAYGGACICKVYSDRLRACEARVRSTELAEAKALLASRDEAWYSGVQAARDAVAALRAPGYKPWGEFIYREVLPAIDALRGES